MQRLALCFALLGGVMLSGCAAFAPMKPAEIDALQGNYASRLMADEELKSICLSVSPMNRILDATSGKVLIDGRAWVTLSSAQRDRIARKAAVLLVDSVNASSIPNGMVVGIWMVDDIGTVMAELRARKPLSTYVYRVISR
jgi:hypothetical protein